jgi:DNA-binding transcriptional regulator GbsR (MarR family)
MITSVERNYLKETIEKDITKMQKTIAKLTKEINEADQILQSKRDLKTSLETKLNDLNQMKQHVDSVIV